MDVVADIAGGFVGGIFSGFGGAILGTAVSAGIRSRFGSGSPSFQSVAAGAAGGVAGSVSSRTLDALKRNIGSWPDKGYENDIFDNIARWVSLNRRSAITRKVFSKSFASFAGAFLGSGVELLINALSGQCN